MNFMVFVPLTVPYKCDNIPIYLYIDSNHVSHKSKSLEISPYLVSFLPVFDSNTPEYEYSL